MAGSPLAREAAQPQDAAPIKAPAEVFKKSRRVGSAIAFASDTRSPAGHG